MNNLHLSPTNFKNESRVLKQTRTIIKYGISKKVYIAALLSDGLEENELVSDCIELKRFELKSRNFSRSIIVQSIKYMEFIFKIYNYYKDKNIKIVNVHSISLLPLGVFLKFLYNSKLVYDTHELETETVGLKGFRKFLYKFIEKKLIKFSDLVFVASEGISKWYASTYNIRKPEVILNCPILYKNIKLDIFRKKFGISKNSTIVLYQGGLTEGRGIELLLESFALRNNDEFVLVFMGYGSYEHIIREYIDKCHNIYLHPAVSPDTVLNYTSSADIGVSYIQNTCINDYLCLPNKLFEYAMAGLPVLVSNMIEMENLVNKYNMGVVIENESSDSMNAAISFLKTLDLEQLKQNARRCAEEHSWEIQEIKMISEYKRMLNVN